MSKTINVLLSQYIYKLFFILKAISEGWIVSPLKNNQFVFKRNKIQQKKQKLSVNNTTFTAM